MTKQESLLISAYTGYLLTHSFAEFHAFCEELLGRPIMTHQLAFKETQEEIREKCKPMIIELIKNIEEEN